MTLTVSSFSLPIYYNPLHSGFYAIHLTFSQGPSPTFVLQDLMDTLLSASNLRSLVRGTAGHSLLKKKKISLLSNLLGDSIFLVFLLLP